MATIATWASTLGASGTEPDAVSSPPRCVSTGEPSSSSTPLARQVPRDATAQVGIEQLGQRSGGRLDQHDLGAPQRAEGLGQLAADQAGPDHGDPFQFAACQALLQRLRRRPRRGR